jgi:hypothetical protein
MGRTCSLTCLMLKGFFGALVCGIVLVGQMRAQEVIVAREKKPDTAAQPTPPPEQTQSESPAPPQLPEQTQSESLAPPQLPEQFPSESPTRSQPSKRKSREKKSSSTTPTLEEMRKAGALAAERLDSPAPLPTTKTRASGERHAVAETPPATPTPRPVKRETRAEETRPSHRSSPASAKPEPVGPIRPTMMETGREEPSATP